MNKHTLILFFGFSSAAIGQTCQRKEIQIKYTDGFEIFNVCLSNPSIVFDDEKEYYWYTEYSKVNSTKGGSGGSLLDGNYKFFDEKGNLREEMNYSAGLRHGNGKSWNEAGDVVATMRFERGQMVYTKHLAQEGYVVEWVGEMFKAGSVKKTYDDYNRLISEETNLTQPLRSHVKIYYAETGKLQKEFTKDILENFYGKYITYYENGQIEIEGEYYDGEGYVTIRIGVWKLYDEQGKLLQQKECKVEKEKWENGKTKSIGGYVLKDGTWLKEGTWVLYEKDGKILSKKQYSNGEEVTE